MWCGIYNGLWADDEEEARILREDMIKDGQPSS